MKKLYTTKLKYLLIIIFSILLFCISFLAIWYIFFYLLFFVVKPNDPIVILLPFMIPAISYILAKTLSKIYISRFWKYLFKEEIRNKEINQNIKNSNFYEFVKKFTVIICFLIIIWIIFEFKTYNREILREFWRTSMIPWIIFMFCFISFPIIWIAHFASKISKYLQKTMRNNRQNKDWTVIVSDKN